MATIMITHSIFASNALNPANTALHLQSHHAPAALILLLFINLLAKTAAQSNTIKMVHSVSHA